MFEPIIEFGLVRDFKTDPEDIVVASASAVEHIATSISYRPFREPKGAKKKMRLEYRRSRLRDLRFWKAARRLGIVDKVFEAMAKNVIERLSGQVAKP